MAKKITVYVINFFLVICGLLLIALSILSNTFFNETYVKEVLERNNYYERTFHSIENDFKNYTMQSGLEDSIVENLYDKNKVTNDINMVMDAIYQNKEIIIDTTSIEQTLDNRIDDILKENNKQPDKNEKEAIKIFEDTIVETYSNGICYSEDSIKELAQIFAKVTKLLKYVEIGLGVGIIILIIVISIINRNVLETIKAFGIAVFSIGIMNILIKSLIGDKAHNILFLNLAFSQSIIDLINSIINTFFIVGIVMSIVGFISIIVCALWKNKCRDTTCGNT